MKVSTKDANALANEVEKLAPVRAAPRPEDITPPEAIRLFVESNVVRAMPRRVSETLRALAEDRDTQVEALKKCHIEFERLERKCKLRFWRKRK